MNFSFFNTLPQFRFQLNTNCDPGPRSVINSTGSLKYASYNIKLWGRSLQSIFSWIFNLKDNFRMSAVNKELHQYTRAYGAADSGCSLPLFRPYVAKVPWHKGARAFLSQLFPRYGHYCGPNWSSGKDNGLPLWDKRPIDWLDFCCYCHDIGYDTHDQAKLLKADLAFLECLERPQAGKVKGDARIAHLYRTMCITGLRNILIPYRRHLVRLQSAHPLIEWVGSLHGKRSNAHGVQTKLES